MSASDDKVRVPIEIDPEDMGELNDLIQRIKDAKSDIRGLEPRTGRGKGDEESRMPYRSTPFEDRGGIFGGETGKEEKFRDKKSAAPFQRGNQFKEMQEELQQVQETQGDVVNSLVNLGFMGGIGAGFGQGGRLQQAQKGVGKAKGLMKNPLSILGMGAGGLKGMSGLLMFGGIYGMIAMAVIEFGSAMIDSLFKPGGIYDTRFRRNIKEEVIKVFDLKEKEDIAQGRRTIRVTTSSALRGTDNKVRSNLDIIANGKRVFDLDGTLITQNTGAGSV